MFNMLKGLVAFLLVGTASAGYNAHQRQVDRAEARQAAAASVAKHEDLSRGAKRRLERDAKQHARGEARDARRDAASKTARKPLRGDRRAEKQPVKAGDRSADKAQAKTVDKDAAPKSAKTDRKRVARRPLRDRFEKRGVGAAPAVGSEVPTPPAPGPAPAAHGDNSAAARPVVIGLFS